MPEEYLWVLMIPFLLLLIPAMIGTGYMILLILAYEKTLEALFLSLILVMVFLLMLS